MRRVGGARAPSGPVTHARATGVGSCSCGVAFGEWCGVVVGDGMGVWVVASRVQFVIVVGCGAAGVGVVGCCARDR
jgi:hypothetical protein